MLSFIIFALFIFIILYYYLVLESIPPNSRGRANKLSPHYVARQPAQIYYPKQEKKTASAPSPATTIEVSSESQKSSDSEAIKVESSADFPRTPRINEFRRPRRAVPIKDMLNSKFNFQPERKRIERTPISEHDEEVYREAERLRILRENRIAEERNLRYFAQKQSEQHDK